MANQSKDERKSNQVVVDHIWNTSDADNHGIMTRDEAKHFDKEYMPQVDIEFQYS